MFNSSIVIKQSFVIPHKTNRIFSKRMTNKKIYSSVENRQDMYNTKLQKKYKIENMLIFYDKILAYKFDVASKLCDKGKCISKQPECKKVWGELENIAILKSAVKQSLDDLDHWLSENDE